MLEKLYYRSPGLFALAWALMYIILTAIADAISPLFGIERCATLVVVAVMSIVLYSFITRNGLAEAYGLTVSRVEPGGMLSYIPLLVIAGFNFLPGFSFEVDMTKAAVYVITMLCAALLEELIFRGMIFNTLYPKGKGFTMAVSSLLSGFGYATLLTSSAGMDLSNTVMQFVCGAALGYMFAVIYYKTESIIYCIAGNAAFKALSVFTVTDNLGGTEHLAAMFFITVISLVYTLFVSVTVRD